MISNSPRQKKIKVPTKLDLKKEYKLLHILNNESFPLYFELDLNYLNLLYVQTNASHIKSLLTWAKEHKYFKIKSRAVLNVASNINEVNRYGDFFEIYHDGYRWNLFSIKNIIPKDDKKAVNTLLGVEELKIRFEE